MMEHKYYICSVGQPGKGYDDENFQRCEKFSAHFMHKDTIQKGAFSRVKPGDIVILKYKDRLVAYGKVKEVSTEENSKFGDWNYIINVHNWVWHNDKDHSAGIEKYGVEDNTVDSSQYGTVKEIESGFGLQKIKEINSNTYHQMAIMNKYVTLLINTYNLILTGAPGTGKTYLAKEIAAQMILEHPDFENLSPDKDKVFKEQCEFVQFHPSYDYTDFVEGLRPTPPDVNGNIGFARKNGVFKEFCLKAIQNPDRKYVMIIDEINRGEISKIFGELFFSIEPDYRGKNGIVQTQYQNLITDETDPFYDGFYVPKNVYIIGTMNDIDRSVESMDFAIRRRFAWVDIKAYENTLMLNQFGDKKDEIVNRMKNLNLAISSIKELGESYNIGGAYFLNLTKYLTDDPEKYSADNNANYNWDEAYKSLWKNHLEGLLKEYLRGIADTKTKLDELQDAYKLNTMYKKDSNGEIVVGNDNSHNQDE